VRHRRGDGITQHRSGADRRPRRLEYRGYDSAGLAVLNRTLTRLRSVGRVAELAAQAEGQVAHHGIAHTRWATHGVPSERNAHPHVSAGLAVVHNGIIENYAELKQELLAAGYVFTSDTDTEVIAHLIQDNAEVHGRPVRGRARAPRRA
jgi:glucosamine--fructose-6-phosphate aminotransferase (isomerizing)